MKAVTISTTSEIKIVDLAEPLHKSAGVFVGGGIEIVRPRGLQRPYVMIVNEEFLLLGLPKNSIGCFLYETHKHGNPILGNIVIMKENGPEIVGLGDLEAQQIMQAMEIVKKLMGSDAFRRGMEML